MENWKDCVDFEGYYEISDQGNARRVGKTKPLAQVINKDGYVCFVFSVNAIKTNVLAHRLVAMALIGPVPLGLIVLHNDGIKTNNTPLNLRYGSNADNSQDMVDHGNQTKGEALHPSKLTEQQVREIRSSSLSTVKLSKLYGVSKGNISMIKNFVTWKHV